MMDTCNLASAITLRSDFFEVPVPAGWRHVQFSDEIVLAPEMPGARIIIRPHRYADLGELKSEMRRFPDQSDTRLEPTGALEVLTEKALAVSLTGIWTGRPAWARLIATLSPFGGGTSLLAVAEAPAQFDDLRNAADSLAKAITYHKVDVSSLMDHLSDMYEDDQGTQILLLRNGVFARRSRGAWSPSMETIYQETLPAWGTADEPNPFGTWTVIGDQRQGTIVAACEDGSREFITYWIVAGSKKRRGDIRFDGTRFNPVAGYRRPGIMDWIRLLPQHPRTTTAMS